MQSHANLRYTLALFWLMASILAICFITPTESRALPALRTPNRAGGRASSSRIEPSTSKITRRTGNLPDVGVVLTICTIPNTLPITFDDGPGRSTVDILNTLGRFNSKTTSFVNERNVGDFSRAENFALLKRAYAEGHQIVSHTFSHADPSQLDASGIGKQMTDLNNMIKGIIGVRVTYMRLPYSSTSPQGLSVLGKLGYYVATWNLDPND
jgi:peptidoglycan/xylan/chitin deacetylase (PgdA/CDA1 family)